MFCIRSSAFFSRLGMFCTSTFCTRFSTFVQDPLLFVPNTVLFVLDSVCFVLETSTFCTRPSTSYVLYTRLLNPVFSVQ